MRTITTKFYGPTNTRGARIKVTDINWCGNVFMSYDYAAPCAHEAALRAYVAKFAERFAYPRPGETWHKGYTGEGYVFVCDGESVTL